MLTERRSPIVTSSPGRSRLDALRHSIEHAAHLLPAQGPITAFVHHNTLHAFEHLPFEQAVVEGAKTFGCHAYMTEEDFLEKLRGGRIGRDDLQAVLIDDLGDRGTDLLGFLGTRFNLRLNMLCHPLPTGPAAELKWVLAETDVLRRFRADTPLNARRAILEPTRRWAMAELRHHGDRSSSLDDRTRTLAAKVFERFDERRIEGWSDETWEAFCVRLLWLVCREGVGGVPPADELEVSRLRHRDVLWEITGQDCDELVHEILIPFCAAFLDQGFARWTLPGRESLLRAFTELYGRPSPALPEWMRGLAGELAKLNSRQLTALESIDESLERLGVDEAEVDAFVTQSLLALRGYAGLLWQVEQRGDRVAHPAPDGTLIDFLAVRLILDRLAAMHVARTELHFEGDADSIRPMAARRLPKQRSSDGDRRAFMIFQWSQLLGWNPQTLWRLSPAQWTMLVTEIEAFSRLERRRIYQLAFERQYRVQALDAVILHQCERHGKVESEKTRRPPMQIVCCIDDREESFRRHLEEIEPACETFGAAGFFAVAMYYRGAADAHFTPLCPVTIKPDHYVTEDVAYTLQEVARRRHWRRRTVGTVSRQFHLGSRTLMGGWLAGVLGSVASIPLVMRILFPRLTARLRQLIGGFVRPPAATRLQLERSMSSSGGQEGHIGYTVAEMAAVVERQLRDIGLTRNFARLVFICGHGSSSLNNPHEAAYDCGACSGGRGGPNARAFAQMANRPDVRELVAAQGIHIPSDSVFIGAYHNTCDDSVSFYDLDSLPASHQECFSVARGKLMEARKRSAHERCRRFESAELEMTVDEALKHVEGRSEDLSQSRPELGHATNALCFVGRREWSRGLFLDRRAFLQSYDPAQDDAEHTVLTRVLQAVIPVCAGINLEYYFSFVDSTGYGCGSKLPHNVTSLLGVMNGAASDLRPGLPWQMVELHEPMRLLIIVETTPAALQQIMQRDAAIARLIEGRWVQLATYDAAANEVHWYDDGRFEPYLPQSSELPEVAQSVDWYRGWRAHLGFARVRLGPNANEAHL